MAKKFLKRKIIHSDTFDNFSVTTTVYGGKRPRTLKGEPKVVFLANGSVKIGCIQITRQALESVLRHAGKFRFHQEGTYEA